MKRPRKYIPFPEKLAATLACLLSQEHRDDLRNRKVPASVVLSLFEWDHIVLHSLGGSDTWENIDPRLVAAHREKSKRDTSIVAKVKRINLTLLSNSSDTKKPIKRVNWPKRKLQSRGFKSG